MATPRAAKKRQDGQAKLSAEALKASRKVWAKLDANNLDVGLGESLDVLTGALSGAQQRAAAGADTYLTEVLKELGIDGDASGLLNPAAFAGHASDGRDLRSLLHQPVVAAKYATKTGRPPQGGKDIGGRLLDRIVLTQVGDAGRAAEVAGIIARPHVAGYVRMVNLPACSRCIVLAGKYFKYHQGFKRHEGCDCVHIPASESVADDLTVDPEAAFKAGQIKGLTNGEREALSAGADLFQVVNAQRGMFEPSRIPGARRKRRVDGSTVEAITSRGLYGSRTRKGKKPPLRLTPDAIVKLAGTDRAEMERLLKLHAYLL